MRAQRDRQSRRATHRDRERWSADREREGRTRAWLPTSRPSAARARYWLGAVYEKQGRKSEAKASYSASLKINPNQEDAAEAMKRVS
ncbi:MAG: tetratricopeptide repeat protein [Acidobacteriota bacterium]